MFIKNEDGRKKWGQSYIMAAKHVFLSQHIMTGSCIQGFSFPANHNVTNTKRRPKLDKAHRQVGHVAIMSVKRDHKKSYSQSKVFRRARRRIGNVHNYLFKTKRKAITPSCPSWLELQQRISNVENMCDRIEKKFDMLLTSQQLSVGASSDYMMQIDSDVTAHMTSHSNNVREAEVSSACDVTNAANVTSTMNDLTFPATTSPQQMIASDSQPTVDLTVPFPETSSTIDLTTSVTNSFNSTIDPIHPRTPMMQSSVYPLSTMSRGILGEHSSVHSRVRVPSSTGYPRTTAMSNIYQRPPVTSPAFYPRVSIMSNVHPGAEASNVYPRVPVMPHAYPSSHVTSNLYTNPPVMSIACPKAPVASTAYPSTPVTTPEPIITEHDVKPFVIPPLADDEHDDYDDVKDQVVITAPRTPPPCVPTVPSGLEIPPDRLKTLRVNTVTNTASNFCVQLMVHYFPELFAADKQRLKYNVVGVRGKERLDPNRVAAIRYYTTQYFPEVTDTRAWTLKCVAALNERLRRPQRKSIQNTL